MTYSVGCRNSGASNGAVLILDEWLLWVGRSKGTNFSLIVKREDSVATLVVMEGESFEQRMTWDKTRQLVSGCAFFGMKDKFFIIVATHIKIIDFLLSS